MSALHHRPMTLAEFLQWEERQPVKHEFDGLRPIAMTGGSYTHARIQRNLAVAMPEIGVEVPVAEFYYGVEFPVADTARPSS